MTLATAKSARPAQFLPIAPGSRLVRCRWCPKFVYWSGHPSTGKPHPISVDTHPASCAPTSTTFGQGVTHWADCAGAAARRKPRGKKQEAKELACIFCGCTEAQACEGGCAWISIDPPICSSCAYYDSPAFK